MIDAVLADDLLEPRSGPGRPVKLTDSEVVCLAVAQDFRLILVCAADGMPIGFDHGARSMP